MTARLNHYSKYYSAKSVSTLYPSPGNIVTVGAGGGNSGKIGYKMCHFVVNFDLFGSLSLDEWLEEDEKN